MNENFCSFPLPLPIAQLIQAWNTHDGALLAECFHADYESVQPHHPERNFWGREAALMNWRVVFETVPDFSAELTRWAMSGDEIWTEWRWRGNHVNGNSFRAGGVIVYGLSGAHIAWARVYTEIEQATGPDWEAVLDEILSQQEAR